SGDTSIVMQEDPASLPKTVSPASAQKVLMYLDPERKEQLQDALERNRKYQKYLFRSQSYVCAQISKSD
ncbi:MAG: hypothetical protein Q4D81_15630, partial [Eubacteriales bacterium]|nr:hypothetical protein [Eubacteriales bacterium]